MYVVAKGKPSCKANSHPSSPEVPHLKKRNSEVSSLLVCDVVLVVPDVSKESSAFIFRVKQYQILIHRR